MSADVRAHVRQASSGSHQEHTSGIIYRMFILSGVLEDLHKDLGDLLGVAPFTSPARLEDGGRCGFCFMSSRKNIILERGFPVSGFVPSDLRFL